jgi:CDP-glycerol glycerophosphotransferase (TagB/SpsB family)/glycosyltransferase involved in cell wall biosynthesis
VRHAPLRNRTVFYESFAGNGVLCNPEAIFRELLTTKDMQDLRHVWVLDSLHRHGRVRKEFSGHPRVRFVRYKSLSYFQALGTSGYLINNATFPPEFVKRPGQIYVNTWHGTPMKKMGYDMVDGAMESANTLRNFVSANFLLSQSSLMTHQMYESAYKLGGVFRGVVLEEGYPRVDRQFMDAEARLAVRSLLEASGVRLGEREVILYAPTWRGESFTSPDDDAREHLDTVHALQRQLGDDRYVVLLKAHQVIRQLRGASAKDLAVLVPNDIPTNVVLGITGILISDYSSIVFDFVSTGRSIGLYTPDAADYAASRGTYSAPADLPGPVFTNIPDLAQWIGSLTEPDAGERGHGTFYGSPRTRLGARDDGFASSRVIDAVFRAGPNRPQSGTMAIDTRIPVLLHLGSMNSNGITTSALNLLASFDYARWDVSVIFNRPANSQQRANQSRVDSHVRQFLRSGRMTGSSFAHLRRRLAELARHGDVHDLSLGQRRMWDDEWTRCFGDSQFTHIIDFDGYGPFWATLLLHGNAQTHSIWLHNDMAAETHRMIRGRQRLRHSLRAVFALYHRYTALVSVSPALCEINRQALASAERVDEKAFVAVRNQTNPRQVRDAAMVPLDQLFAGADGVGHPLAAGVPGWATEMAAHDGTVWFVTVSRYSTEKNQARLIRAFKKVHTLHPEARLVLVGYGPAGADLTRLVQRLDIGTAAFIVGAFANPYAIMGKADCFVLSSDYEGQPLVLLEAAILGMPIVTVKFGSVRDALPDSHMHVVEQDDDALAEGMLEYLRGNVTPQHLDAEAYNIVARNEFLAATLTRDRTPLVQ